MKKISKIIVLILLVCGILVLSTACTEDPYKDYISSGLVPKMSTDADYEYLTRWNYDTELHLLTSYSEYEDFDVDLGYTEGYFERNSLLVFLTTGCSSDNLKFVDILEKDGRLCPLLEHNYIGPDDPVTDDIIYYTFYAEVPDSGNYTVGEIIYKTRTENSDNHEENQPEYFYLSEFYSWIDELQKDEIQKVRFEYGGGAPDMFNDISYSTNSVDIENAYYLLFRPLTAITEEESHVAGGGYVKYDFYTADNTYSVTVGTNMVQINNRHYRFVHTFYYAFIFPDINCNSFLTYDIPDCEEYEIYTYADESVKIGDYVGLSEFEFCVYDGLIESVPHFYLKSSFAVNLLILSANQFMIEGDDNTVVYIITGEKDFSELFAENNR